MAEPPSPASVWLHSAFYRFTPLPDPAATAQALRALAQPLSVLGSIVVAAEGINGTVAGSPAAVQAFESALQQGGAGGWPQGAFGGLVFKHSACHGAPFGRFKVSVRPEIVALGLPSAQGLPAPDERDGSHLSPTQWRALLDRDDVVLLDNRNHFEYRLGHFRGAVDPQVHNFRDFVAHVQQHAPAWRAAGQAVAMYCTGGIRCDKTAPWLRSLGLTVWQLDGGILNYLQQTDPGADPAVACNWQGECYVFDRRIALDARLQPTATTAEQVYDPRHPDEAWRLQRARQLDAVESVDARPGAAATTTTA